MREPSSGKQGGKWLNEGFTKKDEDMSGTITQRNCILIDIITETHTHTKKQKTKHAPGLDTAIWCLTCSSRYEL